MCITLRQDSKTPYNTSNIRWKYAEVINGKIYSPIERYKYTIGKQLNARKDRDPDVGFHVFISKNACMRDIRDSSYSYYGERGNYVILKCEMSNFHVSGTYWSEKCEVWKSMKIVQVFSIGKRDITDKFIGK